MSPFTEQPLVAGYTWAEISAQTAQSFMKANMETIFGKGVPFRQNQALSELEKQKRTALQSRISQKYDLCIGVFLGDNMIGWSHGEQRGSETFNMSVSGILPGHRGRGIYSAMLDLVLQKAREEGFLQVSSCHLATNNAILVPKLKKGFVITGMSMNLKWGWMVDLSYFFNPKMRQAADFRSGYQPANEDLRTFMDL